MARISKEYDERLSEFLDTARQLFFEKGYEKTSVNEIIEKMGVAKGTFYHYFKTKEDLLDQLVNQFTQKSMLEAKKIIDKKDMNAIKKLHGFLVSIRDKKLENKELMKMLMRFMYKDENLLFRYKIFKISTEILTPIFSQIIKQGMEEGCFNTLDPWETAEIILMMSINMNEIIARLLMEVEEKPENLDKIEKKIHIYENSIERILGASEGSFRMFERKYFEIFSLDNPGQDRENQS
jgi:AcrR family transcriptional regulator